MPPTKFGFGGALTRKEDDVLVRGAGRYVADHTPDGALHAVVLRSPHAHARFRITDAAKARAMPGVALLLTASDTADLGGLPCQGAIPDTEVIVPPYPILAHEEVRRSDRDRVGSAAPRGRGGSGIGARRAAGVAVEDRRARQSRVRDRAR